MNNNETTIAKKVTELFSITKELEELYPGRKFTIDGHLVGSIGEVLVADKFNLTLLPNSTKTHELLMVKVDIIKSKQLKLIRFHYHQNPIFL